MNIVACPECGRLVAEQCPHDGAKVVEMPIGQAIMKLEQEKEQLELDLAEVNSNLTTLRRIT